MSYGVCRKAINFDLDTKALQKYYPKPKQWRNAYYDIEKFMKKEGFTHRQDSGYISKGKLSMQRITSVTIKLKETYPWLSKCVNRFDVTDIGKQHDLMGIIEQSANRQQNKISISSVDIEETTEDEEIDYSMYYSTPIAIGDIIEDDDELSENEMLCR